MKLKTLCALALAQVFTAGQSHAQVTEGDSLALVALYNATDGDNWTDKTGWLAGPVSTWFGVTVENGRVATIDLERNGLAGALPPEVGSLDSLRILDLGSNKIDGEIPGELGNLGNLELLSIRFNDLSGSIPAELGSLSSLVELQLQGNDLTGSIPGALSGLSRINKLFISNNQLEGTLPEELWQLSTLTEFFVGRNNLTGPIPAGYTNIPLGWFDYNNTTICAPRDSEMQEWLSGISLQVGTGILCGLPIAESDSLALVALYDSLGGNSWTDNTNWLATEVPLWYGVKVDSNRVVSVDLGGNGVVGRLPAAVGGLDSLTVLDFGVNKLNGTIPPEIGQLSALEDLQLWFNELVGSIPSELGNLTRLERLMLQGNRLTGNIPPELGNLTLLTSLQLGANQIDGPVPASLGNLTMLTDLRIPASNLSGPLPTELTALPLRRFDFNNTDLCEPPNADFQAWLDGIQTLLSTELVCGGAVIESDSLALVALFDSLDGPNWVNSENWLQTNVIDWFGITTSGDRVVEVELSGNGLKGRIPAAIGDLDALRALWMSSDTLTGPIPATIAQLKDLETISFRRNQFTGPIPDEIYALKSLRSLDLSHNEFEGPLSDSIGSMPALTSIFLTSNNLSGTIPESISNLTDLFRLEITGNEFEGEIPQSFAGLTGVWDLGFADNNLSGELPDWLGGMGSLRRLFLAGNDFSGMVPESFGQLTELRELYLDRNAQLTGPLPLALANLTDMSRFGFSGTDLCIPSDEGFQTWLDSLTFVSSSNINCSTVAVEDVGELPADYALHQNYPNPFNPTTTVSYDLPERADVTLSVHDALGRTVRLLVKKEQAAGRYDVRFDAANLPSGLYIYRLEAGASEQTGKMILMR